MGLFLLPAINLFALEQRGLDALGFAIVPASCGLIAGYVVYRARCDTVGSVAESCRVCGYNLTGNRSGRCPECGTDAPFRLRKG